MADTRTRFFAKNIVLASAALLLSAGLSGCGGADAPATEPPPPAPSFCTDDFEWAGWRALLARNPADDDVATLYALRVGLCEMIAERKIEPQRGSNLFDRAQQSLFGRMLME